MASRPHLAVVLDDVHALGASAPAVPPSRRSEGLDDHRRDIPERHAALERRRSMRDHPACGARSRALATVES